MTILIFLSILIDNKKEKNGYKKKKTKPSNPKSGLIGLSKITFSKKQLGGFIVALIAVGFGINYFTQAGAGKCIQGTFRQGSSGQCVRDIQALINYAPFGPKLAVDGQFGPITKSAVVKYQKSMRLVADGIVGPKTWSDICSPQKGGVVPPSWPRAAAVDADCPGWAATPTPKPTAKLTPAPTPNPTAKPAATPAPPSTPAYTPTPTSSPVSVGNPTWLGDYQTSLLAGWLPEQQLVRAAQQARLTAASAGIPARAGFPYVGRFIVAPGDYTNGGTQEERSEVYASQADSGYPVNGQTMWWAWSMYLPNGFHVDSDAESPVGNGWINLTQWHSESGSGGGGLGVSLGLTKGTATPHLIFDATSSEWVDSLALPLGQWNDFRVGITWGDSAHPGVGHVIFKLNGRTVANANANTLQVGQWAYFKQGAYRSASNQTQTIYYTGTRRGPTEASIAY